jgi:hypothetical protein
MTIDQLEHGIRTVCNLLQTKEVYIVGSQSILAKYPNLSGPVSKSEEMDVLPTLPQGVANDYYNQQTTADIINGSAGEGSPFLATHGFEVEGVVESDLSLPIGWRDRTIPLCNANTNGCTGHCLDPHDMAAAKVAAGRVKDRVAVTNLMRQGIIVPKKLLARIKLIPQEQIHDNTSRSDLEARAKYWHSLGIPTRPVKPATKGSKKNPDDSGMPPFF